LPFYIVSIDLEKFKSRKSGADLKRDYFYSKPKNIKKIEKKILPKYFKEILNKRKTFELNNLK
jgi:hypothetical protein